jgi:hypothetical protein
MISAAIEWKGNFYLLIYDGCTARHLVIGLISLTKICCQPFFMLNGEAGVPDSDLLIPDREPRIQIARLRIRIQLFSSVAFKMPTKKFVYYFL